MNMIHTGMHQSESDSAAKHNLCQEIILNNGEISDMNKISRPRDWSRKFQKIT
jgi:hypothetical protein